MQAQIDAIDVILVSQQTQINGITSLLTSVESQIDALSSSAIGNFTAFNFSGTNLTDLTPLMSPVIGNGVFIPYSLMSDGITLKITVWCTVQSNPVQDFRMFLAQDPLGNFDYTSAAYEAQPINVTPVTRKFVYTIMVTQLLLPAKIKTVTETMNGQLLYQDGQQGDFPGFSGQGGIELRFIAQWRVVTALQNFTVNYLTIERVAGVSI